MASSQQRKLGLDNFHKSALEALLQQGMPPIKLALSDWEIKNNLLFFKGRIYVPNNNNLCGAIIKDIYKSAGVGHSEQ
uniref:Reverse transcriptase-rnase h-integrase n=1 Tax=Moniliophthora roreri TaxID=221103 RepID=A0A0W0GDA2_MONRR